MANELATTPPGAPPAPPQQVLPKLPAGAPAWQEAPPGPPGAAIDPPPCQTPLAVAAPPLGPRMAAGEAPSAPGPLLTTEQWFRDCAQLRRWGGSYPPPSQAVVPAARAALPEAVLQPDVVAQPAVLGTPTPAAELEKLIKKVLPHGYTPHTPPGQ